MLPFWEPALWVGKLKKHKNNILYFSISGFGSREISGPFFVLCLQAERYAAEMYAVLVSKKYMSCD